MAGRFVGAPLVPGAEFIAADALSRGEPPLPASFVWSGDTLQVRDVLRTWRSTTTDRGDTYLARHWYEVALADGRRAIVYFDRHAKRGRARWWLYTLAEAGLNDP
ncbi:MAG: hypothetical protein NVS3B16_08660 [Vulcanimicrobiaceae bacterium]